MRRSLLATSYPQLGWRTGRLPVNTGSGVSTSFLRKEGKVEVRIDSVPRSDIDVHATQAVAFAPKPCRSWAQKK
jgi:hypothetical protein